MKGFSGGAVAGVVVGAAALAGLSLIGSHPSAPEKIGVVAEIHDGEALERSGRPAEVTAEVVPVEVPAVAGHPVEPETEAVTAPVVVEPTPEVFGDMPEAPAELAEGSRPEAPVEPVPEVPAPETAAEVHAAPEAEIMLAPPAEPVPEAPAEVASAQAAESMLSPASTGESHSAVVPEEEATSDVTMPMAPALPAAAPLTPEEALDVVVPTEPAPIEPETEVASAATVMPGEAPVTEVPEEAAPGRVRVGGSALPGRDAVRVNRPGAEVSAEEPEPAAQEAVPSDEPALLRHAAVWEPPAEAKPRLALVLLDDGATDPQAVAALPWPVSVALDPLAPDAAGRLAAYRSVGVEALVLARLPEGTESADAAGILTDSLARLPETVAVLDLGEGGLAGRDTAAQMAMSAVGSEGRGVVLGADRMGAGLALAGRSGVQAAELLRDLDGEGQDGAAIRRGLDDAVRRAGQEGEAVVLGRVTADTLAALAEWSLEGRASEVAVAPVSGVLGQ